MTRTVDVYRPAYGSLDIVCPRRFVFWGTSNGTPLNDPTGNRRFVAIDLKSKSKSDPIPLDQIKQYRAAIWARAFHEYNQGTSYEMDADMQERVNNANNLFTIGDSWKDRLEQRLTKDYRHTCLSIDDAFTVLEIPPAQQNATSQKRIREILEGLGYQYAKVTLPNGSRVSRFTSKLGIKQRPLNVSTCLSWSS